MPASDSGISAAGGSSRQAVSAIVRGDEKGDAGLRRDAGDDIAFEIDRKGTCVAPSAAFFCLGCEDRARAKYRAFEGADLPGESSHAGLERFRSRPAMVDGHDLCRYDDVTRAQMRRQGAGNAEADQAIRPPDRAFDERGRAFPVSRADHNGKSRRARDLRFRREAGGAEHGRQSVHPHLPK